MAGRRLAALKLYSPSTDEACMSIMGTLGIVITGAIGTVFITQWVIAARLGLGPKADTRPTKGFVPKDLVELTHRFASVEAQFRND